MRDVISNNRSLLFEGTLGKFFKMTFVNHLAENFNFSTPSFSLVYDKEPHGLKGVFLDFFFWSVDLYYYPAGDAKDCLLVSCSTDPHEEVYVEDDDGPQLTKDNVALRDFQ